MSQFWLSRAWHSLPQTAPLAGPCRQKWLGFLNLANPSVITSGPIQQLRQSLQSKRSPANQQRPARSGLDCVHSLGAIWPLRMALLYSRPSFFTRGESTSGRVCIHVWIRIQSCPARPMFVFSCPWPENMAVRRNPINNQQGPQVKSGSIPEPTHDRRTEAERVYTPIYTPPPPFPPPGQPALR